MSFLERRIIMSIVDTIKTMEGKRIKSVDLKLIGDFESLAITFYEGQTAYINGRVNENGVNELELLGMK
jgi:hypothetical protein